MYFDPSASFTALLAVSGLNAEPADVGRGAIRRSLLVARELAHDARAITGEVKVFAQDLASCMNGQSDSELCAPLRTGYQAVKLAAKDATDCLVLENIESESCDRLNHRYQSMRDGVNSMRAIAQVAASQLVQRSGMAVNRRSDANLNEGKNLSSPSIPEYALNYATNFLTSTALSWAMKAYMDFANSNKVDTDDLRRRATSGSGPARSGSTK